MADYTQPEVVQKRVRFFDGQFLQDQDFIDEQKFHLDRERRQSRLLRLTGVGSGLTVTKNGAYQVMVTRGMAVDSLGRQLVLAADTNLRLTTKFAKQQNIEVHLVYQEAATDLAQTGGKSARRWDESPKIAAVAPDGTVAVAPDGAAPTWDGPTVLLARLSVAENGDVIVDPTAARKAGVALPGSLGVGTTNPASDLEVGAFDSQNRYLTFKVAGGNQYRSGVKLWAWQDNYGYSLEFDERNTTGNGLHIRTHDRNADGTTRLFVGWAGNVGIGTTAPENAEGWTKVVDVLGGANAKLSVRSTNVDARVLAHDSGFFGAPAGMIVGTRSDNALSLITKGANRLSITNTGNVSVNTANASGKLAVGASGLHVELIREATEPAGGAQIFMDFLQRDPTVSIPEVAHTIRFQHQGRFAKRVEVRGNGFHFRHGQLDNPDYADIKARNIYATGRLEVTGSGGVNIDMVVNGRLQSNNNDGGLWIASDRFVGGHSTDKIGLWNNSWRLTVQADGKVGIGTLIPAFKLSVSAATEHLQLRRENNETTGGKLLFLELFQDDQGDPRVPEVYPSIRFHHSYRFWHRIEARPGLQGRPGGFHFKTGNLSSEDYVDIQASLVTAANLRIGGVTIGERELGILQKLAAGTLQIDLYNTTQGEYAYAGGFKYDNDRRYVFTWKAGERPSQGRWEIHYPG